MKYENKLPGLSGIIVWDDLYKNNSAGPFYLQAKLNGGDKNSPYGQWSFRLIRTKADSNRFFGKFIAKAGFDEFILNLKINESFELYRGPKRMGIFKLIG